MQGKREQGEVAQAATVAEHLFEDDEPEIDELYQAIGQPGVRARVVELGRLCRLPNYAERPGFPQHSL